MNISVDILLECYVDTNMVITMLVIGGVPCKGVNHCKGCNKVAMSMNGNKLKDSFAMGIIDKDKRQHSYTNEFDVIGKNEHLELLKHKNRHHFLIRVEPAMDGFILDVTRQAGIDITVYGLPAELYEFTRITKDIAAKDLKSLKSLFKDIKDQKEIVLFHDVLIYLYCHKYDYDTEHLKSLFA